MSASHIRNLGAANHRSWAKREAYRCARSAIDVRFLSVRDALLEVRSLIAAQALLGWRQRSERRT
jgi:hypothetical protein